MIPTSRRYWKALKNDDMRILWRMLRDIAESDERGATSVRAAMDDVTHTWPEIDGEALWRALNAQMVQEDWLEERLRERALKRLAWIDYTIIKMAVATEYGIVSFRLLRKGLRWAFEPMFVLMRLNIAPGPLPQKTAALLIWAQGHRKEKARWNELARLTVRELFLEAGYDQKKVRPGRHPWSSIRYLRDRNMVNFYARDVILDKRHLPFQKKAELFMSALFEYNSEKNDMKRRCCSAEA